MNPTCPKAFVWQGDELQTIVDDPPEAPRDTFAPTTGVQVGMHPVPCSKVTVIIAPRAPDEVGGELLDVTTVESKASSTGWKRTDAVWLIETELVTSLALYTTVSTVLSVTVKVATPEALVVAGEVVITEDPEPAVSETEIPDGSGFEYWSLRVTVIVEPPEPTADTVGLVGNAVTVDVVAEVMAGLNVTVAVFTKVTELVTSVAV